MDEIRLSKRLAQTGLYSRHEADRLIATGKVTINGEVAVSGTKISGNDAIIHVNGVLLGADRTLYYKFNKPKLVLSSYSGGAAKKRNLSDFKAISDMKLGYSGRLDYDSQGLMLLTNDGKLIYMLQRSEFEVEKEYIVDVDREISAQDIKRLERGIEDMGEQFLPCKVSRIASRKYKVILTEGKKRQVRRMFRACGSIVTKLVRTRIGAILLGNLKEGELMELTEIELGDLRKCIK